MALASDRATVSRAADVDRPPDRAAAPKATAPDPAGLPHAVLAMQARSGNGATSAWIARAPRRPIARARRSLQRFDIDDRSWNDVTRVVHLSKGAYEVLTAGGESLVVKLSGSGINEYGASEGPVQEAAAAKAGEIPALGVKTAKTVLIETAGAEGRLILASLSALGPPADDLVHKLRRAQLFLVMERAVGRQADEAGEIVAKSTPADRLRMFYRLGRLWTFDVLINNTDRFLANWGNVILGPGGSVTGIDQTIGVTASNFGTGFAGEAAQSALKSALDAGTRREWARKMFADVSKTWGPEAAALEGEFVLRFELGVLEGLAAVAAMNPRELDATKAQMPTFVAATVDTMGLGGAAIIQQTFYEARAEIGDRLGELRDEIGARERVAGPVRTQLDVPRRHRIRLLQTLGEEVDRLELEWKTVNTWWRGKDAHWSGPMTSLLKLAQAGCDTFPELALPAAGDDAELQAQVVDWHQGLAAIASLLSGADKLKHAAVKPLLLRLREALVAELGRVPLAEQVK